MGFRTINCRRITGGSKPPQTSISSSSPSSQPQAIDDSVFTTSDHNTIVRFTCVRSSRSSRSLPSLVFIYLPLSGGYRRIAGGSKNPKTGVSSSFLPPKFWRPLPPSLQIIALLWESVSSHSSPLYAVSSCPSPQHLLLRSRSSTSPLSDGVCQ
ncbi:hypothetical protein BDN72DRAFT_107994 [Pluteus cervinus]|uniref:Uncharacterized protein n=1 Tax=Pluteus cervinus TaxID=181527 RepID=A0ACD3ANG9_9AGAR|nr:hypothetical protein BDN72DRAFT_107994 [Pluteus cervinus]